MLKALSATRDIVVIIGVVMICSLLIQERLEENRDRAARLVATRRTITQLESAYKNAVYNSSENKGIYQQIFRQNEFLLEYIKLALLRDLVPTAGFDPNAPPTPPGQ